MPPFVSSHRAGTRTRLLGMLAAVTIPHLTIALGGNGLGVLMPLLQRDLGLSPVPVGLLGGARFVGLIVLSIPAAAVVMRIGLRHSIAWLQVGFGLSMGALALAAGPGPAIAAAAAASAFFAATNPATTTAVVVQFPVSFRAQAMNIKQVGVPAGSLLAALLLPAIAGVAGWRGAMASTAVGSIVGGVLSWILCPDPFETSEDSGRGSAEHGAGSTESLSQGSRLRANGLPRPAGGALLPMLRQRAFVLTTVVQSLLMGGQAATLVYFTLFFVGRGIPLGTAAAYLALMQVTGVGARIVWGLMAPRTFGGRRRPTLVLVIMLAALGMGALAAVPAGASGWTLSAVALLLGVGLMAWAGMVELIRAEFFAPEATAMVTGAGYTIAAIGAMSGPPLFGLVTQVRGFAAAWAVLAGVFVCAAVLASLLGEPFFAQRAASPLRSGGDARSPTPGAGAPYE